MKLKMLCILLALVCGAFAEECGYARSSSNCFKDWHPYKQIYGDAYAKWKLDRKCGLRGQVESCIAKWKHCDNAIQRDQKHIIVADIALVEMDYFCNEGYQEYVEIAPCLHRQHTAVKKCASQYSYDRHHNVGICAAIEMDSACRKKAVTVCGDTAIKVEEIIFRKMMASILEDIDKQCPSSDLVRTDDTSSSDTSASSDTAGSSSGTSGSSSGTHSSYSGSHGSSSSNHNVHIYAGAGAGVGVLIILIIVVIAVRSARCGLMLNRRARDQQNAAIIKHDVLANDHGQHSAHPA